MIEKYQNDGGRAMVRFLLSLASFFLYRTIASNVGSFMACI